MTSESPEGGAPSPPPLSPAARDRALREMADHGVELLVIGGGITGAGVARDAALRGVRVGVVERTDFAAGTSGRSSKIIHGGIRYLEYLQFGLVRESARERRILRELAPHLVHHLPFLYPVFRGESLLKIRAGLALFDRMAGSPRGERSRSLPPREVRRYLPGLREPLKGGVLFPEYITDDARFTLANLRSAAEHGALVANHAEVTGFLREGERVIGARVEDRMGGGVLEIRARVTVNATGPFVEGVLAEGGLTIPKRIVPSRGSHLLLDRERLPLVGATFLTSSTGRRGLAIPRGPWIYVGTTDAEYTGPVDRPRADAEEVDDLLAMLRDCFPEADLAPDAVVATWAGLRPLIHEEGKSTRDMSRHDELWATPPGLVTVAGGKLTTYRPMARRILKAVAREWGEPFPGEERTHRVPLSGRPDGEYDAWRIETERRLEGAGIPPLTRDRLLFLYGTEVEELLAFGDEDPEWLAPLAPGVPALRGEVRRAVEREMALTLVDILDRRLALLLFSADRGMGAANPTAAIAAPLLGWSEERVRSEVEAYRREVEEHGPEGGISV